MNPIGISFPITSPGHIITFSRASDHQLDAIEFDISNGDVMSSAYDIIDRSLLDLFRHVSVHVPDYLAHEERWIVDCTSWPGRQLSWVLRPNCMIRADRWRTLGNRLYVENMPESCDRYRTAMELRRLFNQVPQAQLCLNLCNAETMPGAVAEILAEHGDRLGLVHLAPSISDEALALLQPISDDVPVIVVGEWSEETLVDSWRVFDRLRQTFGC